MPYIIGEGEIKTGNTRFHALIQVDLQSFGLKHSQFREYFILNCKKRFDKKWLFFAFSLFTMYLFDRRLETYCPFITSQSNALECFHSRGQYLCKFIGTKESVCIRKEFNSQRTGLRHQHGRRFIVLGHQYGRLDVMWKHSLSSSELRKNMTQGQDQEGTYRLTFRLNFYSGAFTFKYVFWSKV